MGNQEHCRLLREAVDLEQKQQGAGRELWNNWRIAHPEVIPDLSGFHVTYYAEMGGSVPGIGSGDKFKGFDFSEANLTQGYFREANFEEANLSEANLENAKFSQGSFRKTNLKGAIFKRADFQEADLSEADLSETDLREINLDKAVLKKANLSKSNLSNLYLSHINLAGASLEKANLEKAIFVGADLRSAKLMGTSLIKANFSDAVLSSADLRKADLSKAVCTGSDFTKAKLQEAKLNQANLMDAKFYQAKLVSAELIETRLLATNLIEADLTKANLTEANLRNALTAGANFERAELTGACLEDWHITAATNFNGVVCDYIYLKEAQQERRPHSRNFQPREFTKLFQKALETVDIVFLDGIDWKVFLVSFLELKSEYSNDEISIQSFENRNGAFLVRINVPPDVDKAQIEKFVEEKYQLALKAKDDEIFRLNANLMEMVRLLASVDRTTYINQIGTIGIGYSENVQTEQLGGTIRTAKKIDES